ncbi:MAG: delta-lactam-biosynthetic de-N-acetylase [Clostridia bacterium]|nr:delta-lactam-biosynthetic de-N-acetylase [Clostridia bacterium]
MIFVFKKKQILALCFGIAVLMSAFCGAYMMLAGGAVMTSKTDWGLGYGENGSPPTGNSTPAELEKYDAYYVGDTTKKKVYLTFDAGYENGYTARILDVLKKHEVPATFFLVGNYMDTSPELVKRMAEEGHLVGNHTLSHPDMSAISDEESFKKELLGLEEKYKAITGKEMQKIYRPPQGKFSTDNLKMAKKLGYKTFFWSLAYVDWIVDNQPTSDFAFSKLIPRMHNGAIVLLHSTSQTNAEILDELLSKWKEMGYTFGSLTEF